MKKFFCLLAMFLILWTSSSAESKEILFRGLEWGTSYTKAADALKNDGISLGWKSDFKAKSMKTIIMDDYDFFDFPVGYYITKNYKSKRISVAGQEIDNLYLYFAYTDELQTPENARLIGAKYEFKAADINTFQENFIRKLCSLYGDDYQKEEEHFIFDNVWYTWTDASGNTVCLQTHIFDSNYAIKDIYLWYSFGNGADLILDAYSKKQAHEFEKEKERLSEPDVSGL